MNIALEFLRQSWRSLAILAVFSLAIAGSLTYRENVLVSRAAALDVKAERAKWTEEIQRGGPKAAYEAFRTMYPEQSVVSHQAMHLFADLLYDDTGIDALSLCDGSASFGCFHQLSIRAYQEYGADATNKLNALCNENVACIHGIGHGLREYYGDVAKALYACSTSQSTDRQKVACEAGAFMDYLTPLTVDDGNLTIESRPYDARNPFSPCTDEGIPKEFDDACYRSVPSWWMRSGHVSVTQAGTLCLQLSSDIRYRCFYGIGIELAVISGNDVARVKRACDTMQTVEGRDQCWYATQAYYDAVGIDRPSFDQ